MKLYLAGSLFNEAEVQQRKLEGNLLRENFPNLDIFNPIDQPFNEDKQTLPTPIDIYNGDTKAVEECDIFIADLTNEDAGVMVELGIALYTDTKLIIGINSDIRLQSANKYDVPTYGMNHYVLGAILKHGKFVRSFNEAIDEIKKFLENN
nr:nucleoside 2-deoxyribosyltransferase [Helcococcus sueciensis]